MLIGAWMHLIRATQEQLPSEVKYLLTTFGKTDLSTALKMTCMDALNSRRHGEPGAMTASGGTKPEGRHAELVEVSTALPLDRQF